jgi:hypothetical protein
VSKTSRDYSIIDHSHQTELRRANQTLDVIDPLSIENRSLRLAPSNGGMDTTIDPFYQHSVLESQSGIGKAEATINELPKSNIDGDQNEVVRKIDIRDTKESRDLRWSTWWLIGAVLIVIPWVAFGRPAFPSGSRFCGPQCRFSRFSTFILAEAGFGCANSTRT